MYLKSLLKINYGDKVYNEQIGKNNLAHQYYKEGLDIALKTKDTSLICYAYKKIIYPLFYNTTNLKELSYYLNDYKPFAINSLEYSWYIFFNIRFQSILDKKSKISEMKQALKKLNNYRSIFLQANYHQHIGIHYYSLEKNYKNAIFHYNIASKKLNKLPYHSTNQYLFQTYANNGVILFNEKKYRQAIVLFEKADKISISKKRYDYRVSIQNWKAKTYQKLKNYEKAYQEQTKMITYNDSLNKLREGLAIKEFETKYQTTQKEKKIVQLLNTNLKTEAKRVKNRNFLIGSLILLFFGGITAFLINKNTKRKQRIAEQEREIEFQKAEKLLKDQELTAIDAMIVGQEKERQRMANDLHDNLGSTLATIKLHFNHLKNNRENSNIENKEELFSKTNNLLDEAYQKVRAIAHEKNSGVMANQGLLPAIKKLAKNASNSNKLIIEVQDYGLEQRLDNTLEISIFRMIQELVANTIKHSKASEVNISLTNHDSLLNIIIEDNGKGFDAKILPQKDGMGLATIEKRVEHLEGTFEIDSTIGKGTNIIINIPI